MDERVACAIPLRWQPSEVQAGAWIDAAFVRVLLDKGPRDQARLLHERDPRGTLSGGRLSEGLCFALRRWLAAVDGEPGLACTSPTRTFDADGFRRRSACVCIRGDAGTGLHVLLVSSTKTVGRWSLPGGGIDPGETPRAAALRELAEEAGVRGTISAELGAVENPAKRTRTAAFAVTVTDNELASGDYQEGALGRSSAWMRVDKVMAEGGALSDRPTMRALVAVALDKRAAP